MKNRLIMNRKQKASDLINSKNSPATTYWLSVLEEKAQETKLISVGPTTNTVSKAFVSLEEILPHCGIYSPILKIISDELKGAVYSDVYTTSKSLSGGANVLEKVPYFEILQRLQDEKSHSKEVTAEIEKKYQSQILKLKEIIKEKENSVLLLEESLAQNEFEKQVVEEVADGRNEDIKKLEKKLAFNRRIAEEEIIHLNLLHDEAEHSKDELMEEIEDLRRYKISYHTLKDTFDLPADKRPRRGFRRPIISTKKTQLLSSIEAASKLEQQMVEVQSKALEEYDLFLEDVKAQLVVKKYSCNENDQEFFVEELQLETLKDEMNSKLRNFQRLITSTVVELELLRQHRNSLQIQLSRMEQAENVGAGDAASNAGTLPPSSMAGGPGSSRMMTHDEVDKKTGSSQMSLESGLEEDTTPLIDPTSDPFNPQEKLLSKYSAMLYTSVNAGKTFDEISTAQYCVSCGEKTAVCPHKVTKSDMVISLPPNCSHIKISRPSVRLTLPSMPHNGLPDSSTQPEIGKWYGGISHQRWKDGDMSIRRQLTPLWQDAKRRAGIDAGGSTVSASRDLDKGRVVSIVQQFYANLLWNDDHPSIRDHVTTIRGYFYEFVAERYNEDEISAVATYDLITGIVKYAEQDKTILLLGHALAGLVDGSAVRYALIVADLIDQINWQSASDFRYFSQLLYPFLEDDEVDHFVLEFHAFTENKISRNLVLSYLIHVITKNKEPRMLMAESKLATYPMKNHGHMIKKEYLTAMENISPLANEELLLKLTQECMHSCNSELLPIKRLASVTAYIAMLQIWQLLKSQVDSKLKDGRYQDAQNGIYILSGKSVVPEGGPIITMSQVKQLASNISRLRLAGTSQLQQSFPDEMYWQSPPTTRDQMF